MEIEVGKVAGITEILTKIAEQELPAIKLYNVIKTLKKTEELSKPYIETKETILKKYSNDGERAEVKPEDDDWDEFVKEINSIAMVKVELDVKLKVSDISDTKIDGRDMYLLSEIIEDE